jgi:spore maturation protein CgeB
MPRSDLLAKVWHYLHHPHEAWAIAQAGQREALLRHRARHRVEYVANTARERRAALEGAPAPGEAAAMPA